MFSIHRDGAWISRLNRGGAALAGGLRPEVGEILDLGGVVKGWAVERAAAALRHAARDRLLPVCRR